MLRRLPWWGILVAFVVLPVVEIYVLIQVGQAIGAGWTVLLLVADAVFGTWLVKHEGTRAWQALTLALHEGRMPARELADGALVVLGGALMVSPGFVTDLFGIACILPFTRPLGRRVLAGVLGRHLARRMSVHGGQGPAAPRGHHRDRDPHVVHGDVVE